MKGYFFLIPSLPDLHIGNPPELSWDELTFLLSSNLSADDYEKVRILRSYFDLENIRSLWSGFPLNRFGNFDEVELEQALLIRAGLPSYVYEFMDRFDSKEERLKHFSALLVDYYNIEIQHNRGFLKSFFTIERAIRLILTAFRAKTLGRNVLSELQFEDPQDPLVADILAQKDAKNYEPPAEYQDLKLLYEAHQEAPLELQKALLQYRFRKISELTGLDLFNLDQVLTYVFQWILVEKWNALDQEKGKKIINSILQGIA